MEFDDRSITPLTEQELLLRAGKRCKRLWYSVLVQAVEDYHEWLYVCKPRVGRRKTLTEWEQQTKENYDSAVRWLTATNTDETTPFSFRWVCDMFDIPRAAFLARLYSGDPTFVERVRRAITHVEKQ